MYDRCSTTQRARPTRSGAAWRTSERTGVLVTAEHDGAGMTMVEAGVVAEELGAALYAGPWLSSAVAAARALARTGADDGLLWRGSPTAQSLPLSAR